MTERSRYDMPGDDTDALQIEHYKQRAKPTPPAPEPDSRPKQPNPDPSSLAEERAEADGFTQPARATVLMEPTIVAPSAARPTPAPQTPQTPPQVQPQAPVAPPAAQSNGSYRATPRAPYIAPPAPPMPAKPTARPKRDPFVWIVALVLVAAGTLLAGTLAVAGIRLAASNAATQSAAAAPPVTATPTLFAPTPEVTPEPPGVQIEPWDGNERFTILLLGLDKRPNQTGTAFRTDSMMLVSLDPATDSIGILSIPRDLYVEIPPDTVVGNSYGLQRVNTAYFLGESVQEGYGPMLAMQTVQYNLGIRVHDYMVYDFEAVMAAIDAVGGITIDVKSDIVDNAYPDMYGGYDPLYIRAGRQSMNGELALKYARTRHGSSDIDRARRQQEVIFAVRDRILSADMLPSLLLRAPELWAQLSRHVRSGLALDQLLRLGVYASRIPVSNIHQGVIGFEHVDSITWNGAAVLVPNRVTIGPLLVQVFGSNYNQ
ncbi:MAG: LCP family protein [Anaerolineae bacterium]|nr:LCP family protein [Anaerolineae bacterium]